MTIKGFLKQSFGIGSPSREVVRNAEAENRWAEERLQRILQGAEFREYERPIGLRGSAERPEYRIVDIWDGREVDEGFTFSLDHAKESVKSSIDQAYDVELYVREDGDWRLLMSMKAD